jgi:aarF domain-containing kinase
LPRVKIPKQTENKQSNDEHVQYGGINSDSYSATSAGENSIPAEQAVLEQERVPEGTNTDLFYSPRVAKMLGGRTQVSSKGDLRMKTAEKKHPSHTSEIFGVKPEAESSTPTDSLSTEEAATDTENQDDGKLAKNIAGDVSTPSNVSIQ